MPEVALTSGRGVDERDGEGDVEGWVKLEYEVEESE
jgi:hypothetical protein